MIGTGDLSELALGWATYNGDHMSMYGVNVSIPKTLIRHLVQYVADYQVGKEARQTLMDIIDTPISPELIPADENGEIKQKTEDLVGPYELHDFYLYYVLRFGFSPTKIYHLARTAFDGKYEPEVLLAWLLRRMDNAFFWAVFSGLYGLCFGGLCAAVYLFAKTPAFALSWWLSGLSYDALHGVGNFVLMLLLYRPLRRTLQMAKKQLRV